MTIQTGQDKIAVGGGCCEVWFLDIDSPVPVSLAVFVTRGKPVYFFKISEESSAVNGIAGLVTVGTEFHVVRSRRAVMRPRPVRLTIGRS